MIFMKLTMFRAPQAPPQPKTMRQTKYLDPKASHEKKYDFSKNHFFAEIFTFFETSKSENSRSDRSGGVHIPNIDAPVKNCFVAVCQYYSAFSRRIREKLNFPNYK